MTQHDPIKRAGTIQKAERKLLRFFNHKSGAGIIAATFLMVGTGGAYIVSTAEKSAEQTHSTANSTTSQQFRQEAEHIVRDVRSIKLIKTDDGFTIAPQDQACAAQITHRANTLATRIAFDTTISETEMRNTIGHIVHNNIINSKERGSGYNPTIDQQTDLILRRLRNSAEYRDEALKELGNTAPTQQNLIQLTTKMGEKKGNRIDWVFLGMFLGLPLGSGGLVMGASEFTRRRQRKTDQQERTEISYDTMQDIKKKMTPKATVRVSYGNKP